MAPATHVRPFVHLRVHSSYSLGVGLSAPADICAHAHRSGYHAIALTDINGTYGFVEFHHAARALGIKPVYGVLVVVDARVGDQTPADERHALTLLALDRGGLRNVCAAASASASRREAGGSFAVADLDGLAAGVVCIVGLPSTVTSVLPRSSRSVLTSLQAMFDDRLFVEELTHVPGEQTESRAQLAVLARSLGVAPVLCADVRFVGPEKDYLVDLVAGEDPGAVDGSAMSGPATAVAGHHGLLSPADMSGFYDANQEAFTNASLVASLVEPDILDALGTSERTGAKRAEDLHATFAAAVRARFDREFEHVFAAERAVWEERLRDEMEIIRGTELEDAFVRFQEVVRSAKGSSALLGPATGLRLQSLCAYLLGVTRFNPYRIDPTFQPFFDERDRFNRILDLQVATGARRVTVAGLKSLFDDAGIGYVPTIEHITAARALRMTAARLEPKPPGYDEILRIASHNPGATLQELCTESRRIGYLYKHSSVIREVVAHAAPLEGLPYGFIRSKRTVIISPTPLRDFLGETTNPRTGERFVQSTRDSFPIGSISRVDFTTLRALDVCARVGVSDGPGATVSWEEGRGHDDIYRLIHGGDVDGVYLLETALIQRVAQAFGIASFDDLIRFLALMRYRRGGLLLAERVEAYRKGRGAAASDEIDARLEYTNGWLLFHDQLRDIVSGVTGLDPLNAAQMVRRFARHEPGELAALRREFMTFAVERGTRMDVATKWFARVLHAAGSTVNRQHVIADALVVSTMLYLKSRQPIAFLVALANAHRADPARRQGYLDKLAGAGRMLGPDINESGVEYVVTRGGIRPPLWTIDGVDEEIARRIVRGRGRKKVRTPDEFDLLIAETGISYKSVEALVGAGALESVGIPAGEKGRLQRPSSAMGTRASGQAPDQFALPLDPSGAGVLPAGTPPSNLTPPEVNHSENVGNNRISFHVLPALTEFYPTPIARPVEMVGRIRDLRTFKSGSGETVAFFMLFDSGASVPVFVPWERVDHSGEPLVDGERVLVRGIVRVREGKKACEALEVTAGGGIEHGETAPDQSAEGDP